MAYVPLAIYFFIGLGAITLIDTIGAIASRKFNFKYYYLSIVSFVVYVAIAYLLSKEYELSTVLFTSTILGLYDGTVGFWLSIILRANNGQTMEQSSELLGVKSAVAMIIMSLVFAIIGYILSTV